MLSLFYGKSHADPFIGFLHCSLEHKKEDTKGGSYPSGSADDISLVTSTLADTISCFAEEV